MMNPKDIQRFMSKVRQSRSCWEWTAGQQSHGYGIFHLNNKIVYAHRISFELFKGDIPTGMELDHLCRNRLCVNPDHLEPVTHLENLRRGVTGLNQNTQKTHCPKGHPYTKRNKQGSRICHKCKTAATTKYRRKKTNPST